MRSAEEGGAKQAESGNIGNTGNTGNMSLSLSLRKKMFLARSTRVGHCLSDSEVNTEQLPRLSRSACSACSSCSTCSATPPDSGPDAGPSSGLSLISRTLSSPECAPSHSSPTASEPIHPCYHRSDRMSQSLTEVKKPNPVSYGSERNVFVTRGRDRFLEGSTSGSTDSLARNSLLAAKVLHLIPTQQAKERNFLHGRLASNSLLGAVELERVFPNREVEVFVGTWNMNGQMSPKQLDDFIFPNDVKHIPDILAIGTQESSPEKSEWEISIQEVLGPSHLLFHSTSLGTLHLSIFLRRDLIWFCSLPEDSHISVRPGTAFRTKGAIAISFTLFGTTFLFITAHLTAHQEKVKERVSDIKRIIRSLDLPKNLHLKNKNKDVTSNFDVVFLCGDLNFRLMDNRESVLRDLAESVNKNPTENTENKDCKVSSAFPPLLQIDQLSAVLSGGTVLRGFKEAPIHFAPTYKYDIGTQRFDTSSKQRTPAYTDRILYKTKMATVTSSFSGLRRNSSLASAEAASTITCLAYDSVPSICSSDHKPVWALFTATLRPGTDIVPLAAGLFNREVYLEGIKRRAAVLDHPPGTSIVCCIQ